MWIDDLRDMWKGETVVVLGGGPTALGYGDAPLKCPTIALNYAHRLYPEAEMTLVVKEYIYRDVSGERPVRQIVAPRYGTFSAPAAYEWYASADLSAFQTNPSNQLYSNVGTGAAPGIHLASVMGAKRIVLAGVDLGFDGETYYAAGYRAKHGNFIPSGRRTDAASTEAEFAQAAGILAQIRELLAARGTLLSFLSPTHWREHAVRALA